jgi:prefoldin subunit 5
MYNDTEGDDDCYEEITEIIEKHKEKLVHSIDKYETEIKRKANDISKAPSYDIDLDR